MPEQHNVNQEEKKQQAKRIRGMVFFGFYFVFFLVLIISIRSNSGKPNPTPTNPTPTPTGANEDITDTSIFKGITNQNYHYVITVRTDNRTVIYDGKQYSNKSMFTKIADGKSIVYYQVGDNYLEKQGEATVVVENPYENSQFWDVELLKKIIDRSTYKEEDGVRVYSLDAVDFMDYFYPSIEYDGFSIAEVEDNQVFVTVKDDMIAKVEMDLSNGSQYHASLTKEGYQTLNITLEYTDYGNIDDFTVE